MGANPTEELAVALKETDIVTVLKGIIPAGAKGDKGDEGKIGPKGPKGDAGTGGGGAGIAPADQAKLDHITIAFDLDIDTIDANAKSAIKKVGDLNLDGSGATLMTAKDVELAQAQVVPTDPVLALKDNRMITVASTIAAFNNMSVKVMMEKGVITDISGITETGIYEGQDVANSPMTGPIMVMANKDSNGDFGFFLMGADGALHTGGKAQLGSTFWTEIKAKAVAEGSIEVDASYSGRFVSPNMDTFTGQATHDLYDQKEHKVMFIDKSGNDWSTDKDPYAWYLKGGGELGHFKGASGHVGSKVMEGWVKHKNIVTIQYTDSTKKEFNVLKVEGDTQIGGSDHLVADGSVKVIDHLVIGDRSGEAQVTLDAKAAKASHTVFKREGVAKSSIGVVASNNDELIIEQRAADDIRFILPKDMNIVAKIGTKFHTVAFDLPLPPTADGDYKLNIAAGVATWVTV